jgi:hypothetical protein
MKPIIKYFNIHNLVKIKICSIIRSKVDEVLAHLREFEVQHIDENLIDIFIYDYSKSPPLRNPMVSSRYYYYSENFLNIPKEKFCFNCIDTPFFIYCNKFLIPLNLLIELILLEKGYSFIHSAAVEYNGKTYLFPALGGIGKTTTIAILMFKGGKLYGDDLNIIKGKEIFGYPTDFSVYQYHLDILKIKNRKIKYQFKLSSLLDKVVDKLINYNNFRVIKLLTLIINSIKLNYINIPPKIIFGEDCLKNKGQINEIYYLCREEDNSPQIIVETIDPNKLAEISTNILFHEWYQSLRILYIYSSFSSFSVNSFFNNIKNIFQQTFMYYNCYQIKIPSNLNNLAYQKQLIKYLNKSKSF